MKVHLYWLHWPRLARRVAQDCGVVCALVICSGVAFAQQRPHHVQVTTELISLTVTATDSNGRHVSGLTRDNFTVYDDQVAQQITYFSNTDSPASIGFAFDVSSSMRGEKIVRAREAMKRFIQTSHAQDEYSLICFNQTPQVAVESARDGEALLSKLSGMQPRGQTALYDAVSLGLKRISHAMHPKRALIVLSDGEDNSSRISFDQLRRQIKESDALIYTILVGPLKPLSNGGVILEMMSEINGGKSFFPSKTENLDEIFEEIAVELRRQYSLAYEPSNFIPDGKWHRLKVKVNSPVVVGRIVLRTREGYYARLRNRKELGAMNWELGAGERERGR